MTVEKCDGVFILLYRNANATLIHRTKFAGNKTNVMKSFFAKNLWSSLLTLFFFVTNAAVLFCCLQVIVSIAEPVIASVKSALPLAEQKLLSR